MIDELADDQRKRLRRHPVAVQRDCSMGVVTFENLECTHLRARIIDLSATGLGVESDHPIEPGIIWFNESVSGQKCGVLVWCKQNGYQYRAGIQFVSLSPSDEKYFRQQLEQSLPNKPLHDPERIVAGLVAFIRDNRDVVC
jgi:hypothetical protein